MNAPKLPPILLVEDSPEDHIATVRAFERSGLEHPLIRVADGDEALDYLHGRPPFKEAERPALILLDLNLPGTDGFDVLRESKSDEKLRTIPVVVLTTSGDPNDAQRCYDLGANTFVKKPVDIGEFFQTIDCIHRYWIRTAMLPPNLSQAPKWDPQWP